MRRLQMAVDDLVAAHIDAGTPPSEWRLTTPIATTGSSLAHLSDEELDQVHDVGWQRGRRQA